MKLRVGVVGAGAIGRYVAAFLADSCELILIGRDRQAEMMARVGLRATALDGTEGLAQPGAFRFASSVEELGECDVVLVCVKSGQTKGVADSLTGVLSNGALVVSLQNGVSNAPTLRTALPNVAAAVVGFNAVITGDVVVQTTSGPLVIEDNGDANVTRLVSALAGSGLDAHANRDIAPEKWTKLLVNLSNAISALSGVPTVKLIRDGGYRRTMADAMIEGRGVLRQASIRTARLHGLPLGLVTTVLKMPTPLVKLMMRSRLQVDPEARASMWADLEARRPTEVEYLNGEIVRLAAQHGLRAPINRRLVELVHQAESAESGSPQMSAETLRDAIYTTASPNG